MIKKILFLAALIISSIQSYSQVAITATTTDVTCYGGNDGVITVNVTAGTGPYRYTLYYEHASGDFRLGDHPGIAASSFTFQTGNGSLNEPGAEAFGIPKYGSYRVRVISSDPIAIPGNPKSLNVSVDEPTEVIYTTNIIADCGTGNGSVAFTVSDGTPGYTISWTAAPGALPPGGAIASSGGSFTESNLIFGEYIFDITDANSCVKTDTITVEAPPIDQPINESPAATICDGDTQDVTLANSELGVDYQVMLNGAPFDVPVSGDGGANQLLGTLTQADGLTVAGSPHVITVQASRSGCTITLSDNISVTVNPYPNATITPVGPYCEADAPVNLTAATPGGLWSGDGITDGVLGTFDPATAGVGTHTITYTVTVGGCTSIDTEDIVVDEALDPTIDPEGPFCETDAAINLAAADPGGTWSGAGITDGAAGTFNPATAGPGTHTITYTLVNGACTTVDTEDIVVDAALDPTITPAGPYCETDVAVNLVAATGGGLWTGDGITDGAAGTFDPATAGVGTHTITYTIINGACTTVDTEDIVVDEALDPTITAAGPYCETDAAVNLTAANPGGTWSGTGITDGAAGTFNPATAGIGTHTITYTLVNGACTTVDTEDIVVDAALDPTINPPAPFCETDAPVNLTAATGGGTWTGTGITDGLLGTFDPVTAGVGTHTITYTIINGACTTVDTEDIVVDAALDPTITAAGPFCESDAAVNLIAATGGGTWTGTGITDGIAGTFDPATAGVGTHTITYTIVNGACTTVDTEDINVKPLPIDVTITLSGPRTVCEGTSVLVTLDDSESGTNYQVMFNGVPFGPSHPGVGSTNHILENIPGSSITAAGSPHLITVEATRNGCVLTLTDNIEVTVDTATDPTIDPAGPYCETDAAANLTAANPGGTWSGTGITDGVAGIFDPATAGAGTHTVTYTLVNGACTTSDTEDIVVDAALDPTITATGPFCETDASVNLTAATGGGTWSGTGITDGAVGTFDPVTAGIGTHTITYTVVNGACTTVDTEDIIVDAALDATITVAGPFCESDVAVNLIAANPGGTWSGTGITDGAAGTFDPGTAGVGTHTITYTLVNGACTTIDTEDIIVDAALDPTITPAGPYCETDAAVNLSAATAGGTWSGTGITDGALGTFDPVISGHGTHTITYTVVNGGCTTVDTEDIIVDAEQDATITAAGPFCEFDAPVTIVGATAGGIWSGTGITDGAAGTFNPTTAGAGVHTITYTVINGGCTTADTEDITVNTASDATITPATFCEADAATDLTAATPGGIWSGTGITDAGLGTFDPTTAGAGTHTITYSVDNGTCTTVDTEDIVVNPSPDTTIAGNIAVCVNSTETYTVPAGETTYAWVLTGGDGSISSGAGTNSITIDWISAGGDLSVTITGAAPSSCVSSSTITVGVYSTLPAMPDESINACQNSGVYPTLTATPDPGAIVSWYIGPSDTGTLVGTGDTFTPTSAELDLSIVATTTFTYIQDIGCLRSLDAAYDVIVIPGPDAGIDSAALTCSSYAPFDLTTKLGGTPLLGGTWTWDDDNGTGALSGSIFNPALCGDGTYNFTYEVNGAGACTGIFDTSSLELTVSSTSPDPVVNQVIYEGCTYTDPPELSAVGGGIIWYSDAALSNAVGTGENFTPTDGSDILMNIIGTTSFYVTQNEGCGESAGVQVDVILEGAEAEIGEVINTYPEQDIGSIEVLNMISSTDSIPFDASLLDGADSTIIYDWQTVEENRLGEHIHLFALLPEGNYIVQVRDANGCIFPIAQPITYKTDLFIPNVFTPNNDDYNEYFKVLNKPDNTKILITNRWGIKVFESDDYQNDWNAEGLPEGVYFYTIQTGGKVYRGNVEVWRNAGPSQYKY